VGEILGGDPSADRSATYRTESGTKQDVLTFTLKRSRRGQAEVVPPPVSQDAAGTGVAVDLTAPMAASSAAVVVEVPSGAKVDKVTGGLARSSGGSGGLDLYARTVTPITVGTRLAGSLRYTGGNTAASGGGTSASPQGSAPPVAPVQQAPAPSSPVPPPQAFLVLTAIIALTFIALKRVAPAPAETPHAHHHQTRRHASGGAE
jgi:hypothetical protein